jgi:hypothetical protein
VQLIGVEAGKTLILERVEVERLCGLRGVTLAGF